MSDDMFELRHPDPSKQAGRCHAGRYHAMKAALLEVIPANAEGIAFAELREAVRAKLPATLFEGASVGWFVTSVKLDLEARGQIERVAGSGPQYLRRSA